MSHFVVLVLTEKGTEREIAEALDPFNEQTEVEEHEVKCYCIGNKANLAAIEAANKIKHIDTYRKEFHANPGNQGLGWEEANERFEKFVSPYHAEVKKALDAHPLKDKPSPDCGTCHGTGIDKTTYNPISKLDWWVIGGRWEGALPNGKNKCKVSKLDGFEPFAIVYPKEGKRALAPSRDEKVSAKLLDKATHSWEENGKMGWWGIVRDRNDGWPERAKEILAKFPDLTATLVDCHI